jgi:TetR/AcrR family transcriptional regulator, regulator of cefoperazone and chloramphenicol sensitivity
MCSARRGTSGDLTARAVIRDEALRLFARYGPEAVSLRRVAAAAGVSPGLVVHHVGSRAGLREAVDAHVARLFDDLFSAMATSDWQQATAGASLAEAVICALPPDSAIPGYLRRLLLSADPAGRSLFTRWYALTEHALDQMSAAGVVRAADDPPVRAAFLMANDLAVLLLREQIAAVLGVDPLSRTGIARWTDVVIAVYRDGIFTVKEET